MYTEFYCCQTLNFEARVWSAQFLQVRLPSFTEFFFVCNQSDSKELKSPFFFSRAVHVPCDFNNNEPHWLSLFYWVLPSFFFVFMKFDQVEFVFFAGSIDGFGYFIK